MGRLAEGTLAVGRVAELTAGLNSGRVPLERVGEPRLGLGQVSTDCSTVEANLEIRVISGWEED